MTNKTKELVAAGHALAKELHCAESAALVRELATQLDVQRVRVEESQREFRAADATIENLQMQVEKMAAENAGLKKFCEDAAFDADYESELLGERGGFVDGLSLVKTPATDAFLAEVRAQGVEMFAESQKEYVRKNRDELDSMTRAAYCGSAVDAERFAAQLRKGVQS